MLAPQAKTYFCQAMQFHDWGFVTRPGVFIIAALTAAAVFFRLRHRVYDTGQAAPRRNEFPDLPKTTARLPQFLFAAGITVILAVALEDALYHSLLGKILPSAVAVIGLTMTLFLIPQLMRGAAGHATHFDAELSGDYAG